jgi:hypothetical protein
VDGHPATDEFDVGLLRGREGAVVAQDTERSDYTHGKADGDEQTKDDQKDDEDFLPEGAGRRGGGHGDIICRIGYFGMRGEFWKENICFFRGTNTGLPEKKRKSQRRTESDGVHRVFLFNPEGTDRA